MDPFLVEDLEWDSVEQAIQQAEKKVPNSTVTTNTPSFHQSNNNGNIKPVILETLYGGNCNLCIYFKSPKLSVRYGYQKKQDHRVNLPQSSVHPEIIYLLSKFPGYRYSETDHVFYINFEAIDQLEKQIQPLIPSKILQYRKIPLFVKEFYKRYRSKIPRRIEDASIHFPHEIFKDDNNRNIHPYVQKIKEKLPPNTLAQLKPFQIDSIIFTLSRNGRILLADSPGLGKTIQSICISLVYKEYWPVLVVVPSSVRLMWASEFKKWAPELEDDDINVIMTSKGKINGKINITSYGLIDKFKDLVQNKVGIIICDESHLLKSWNSKRTKAIQPLIRSTKIAILLSGTPATSKPSELYSQLQSINPYLFGNFQTYADRYCDPKPRTIGGIDYSGSSNLIELNAILNESIMIRRTKDNVLQSLPTKRRHMELLDIPRDQKELIKQLSSKLKTIKKQKDMSNDLKKENWVRHSIIFELFRNTGRAKLPSVVSYLIDQLNEDSSNKILIFAHHQEIIEGIELSLIENHVECIRIDGKTPGYARQDLIDHFQNKESCRVAILSITAAGVGVTLNKANKVLFAELFWNPGLLTQAEDRAHRYGQEREVDIHYLIAKGTIDERVWDVIETKLSVLGETFDGKASSLNLDSKNLNNIDISDNIESNSFIQYLIQKINDYEERIEESIERYDIRTKIRNEVTEDVEIDEERCQKRKKYDNEAIQVNKPMMKKSKSDLSNNGNSTNYDLDKKKPNLKDIKLNEKDNAESKEDISTIRSQKLAKYLFNS